MPKGGGSTSGEIQKLLKEKKIAQKKNNLKEEANCCNLIGTLYFEKGDFEEAVEFHQEELRISVKAADSGGVSTAQRKLAECYAELRHFDIAVDYCKKYLHSSEKLSQMTDVQLAWHVLGRIYLQWAVSKKAGDVHDTESVDIAAECADEMNYYRLMHESRNCFEKALFLCDRLEGIVSVNDLTSRRAGVHQNLGTVAMSLLQSSEAYDHLKKAIDLARDVRNWDLLTRSHFALAELLVTRGQQQDAMQHALHAIEFGTKSSNKEAIFDGLVLAGRIHLVSDQFLQAKNRYKAAINLKVMIHVEWEEINKQMKSVRRLSNYQREIANCTNDDTVKLKKIYEKIGDILATKFDIAGCSELALKYYKLMLSMSQQLREGKHALTACYVSLWRTYDDLGWYDDALYYLEKQLDAETDIKEQCSTMHSIAMITAKAKKPASPVFERAAQLAERVDDAKLQAMVCRDWLDYLKEKGGGTLEDVEKVTKKLDALGDVSDCSEAQSEHEKSSTSTDIDSNSSEGDEAKESVAGTSRCIRTGGYKLRTNEKGETELHRACIEGHTKLVERLLAKGHPVNVRDHAGWTPIHEACNWNFPAIVRLLIDYGANMEATCDGLTPLLDAAAGGSFDVIEVLLNAGASTAAVDKEKRTVIDLLESYKSQAGELDEEDASRYKEIRQRLLDLIPTTGSVRVNAYPSNAEPSSSIGHKHPAQRKKRLYDRVKDNSEAGVGRGARLYREAIANVAASAKRRQEHCVVIEEPTRVCSPPAMVTEEEYFADENRIIEDNLCYLSKPEKSVNSIRSPEVVGARNRRSSDASNGSDYRDVHVAPATELKNDQVSVNNDEQIFTPGSSSDSDDAILLLEDRRAPSRPKRRRLRQTKLSARPIVNIENRSPTVFSVRNEIQPAVPITKPSVIRTNVVIGGKIFAVHSHDRNATIQSLADRAASMYETSTGKRVTLNLFTADDALLDPSDTIDCISDSNNQLIGKIDRYEVPPVTERYRQVCGRLKTPVYDDISENLTDGMSHLELDFRSCSLKSCGGPRVILQALQAEYSLLLLNLRGQKLSMSDVVELGKAIVCLQSLERLDLTATGLLREHLCSITNELSRKESFNLEHLNLSFNNLCDSSIPYLCRILLRCPRLNYLNLSCTGITSEFCTGNRAQLCEVFNGTALMVLDLSKNEVQSAVDTIRNMLLVCRQNAHVII